MPAAAQIQEMLEDARSRTLALLEDLSDERLEVPRLPEVNPLRWEIGHIGWFQEYWLLRHPSRTASLFPGADALWDSSAVAHDTRWDLPLPGRESLLDYLGTVLGRVRERLGNRELDDGEAWLWRLAVFHEDMHGEALLYTRQTLGHPAPPWLAPPSPPTEGAPAAGDVAVPGGIFHLGAAPGAPFVFDNEKWAHPVELAPFSIASQAVTFGEFAAFVDEGGYERPAYWSSEGWAWRESAKARHPVYWRSAARGGWQIRLFDSWLPLPERAAVVHVNAYEAEAYCRWAHRRLPTEAEWELAASGFERRLYPWGDEPPFPDRANLDAVAAGSVDVDRFPDGDSPFGCRQMLGNVWEWTASAFAPYPGFVPDPYRDYSQPWFGTHHALRGGCWATRSRVLRNTWRNFFTPERRDVFAGFRTCALVAA